MISLIVAYDKNKCIGKNNGIPWKISADMKRVKELTTNQTILMGRKTYESLGRALPNRINRVLTKEHINLINTPDIEVFNNKEEAIKNLKTDKLFIFGGSKIYEQYLDICEELFITEVDAEIKGDSYFPNFNLENWELVSEEKYIKDEKNEYDYKFLYYIKKG